MAPSGPVALGGMASAARSGAAARGGGPLLPGGGGAPEAPEADPETHGPNSVTNQARQIL